MDRMKQKVSWFQTPTGAMTAILIMYLIMVPGKMIPGLMFHSPLLEADAWHQTSDILTAILILLGVQVGNSGKTKEHIWGKSGIEPFISLGIGLSLGFLALYEIGLKSVFGIILVVSPGSLEQIKVIPFLPIPELVVMETTPRLISALVMGVSALVLFRMSRFQIGVGKKYARRLIEDDGEETASDGRLDALAFAGILLQVFIPSFGWIEYLCGLGMAWLMLGTAKGIVTDAWKKINHAALDAETTEFISGIVNRHPGILGFTVQSYWIATCMVVEIKAIRPRLTEGLKDVRQALTEQIGTFLEERGHKEYRVRVRFEEQPFHEDRVAYLISERNGREIVGGTVSDLMRVLICDRRDSTIFRGREEETTPEEIGALLLEKRIGSFNVFCLNDVDLRMFEDCLDGTKIPVVQAPSFRLNIVGIRNSDALAA
ncbi:MAG: Cation efflux protein [Candidatus Uhrbacteria bacterium GW2011_GWF2_41_16]|uniref:Cation efflux protein n=2 Tax=Candidatus Uhriibacteriota TaxID=1752732 RepID=A0A0G0VA53_9BACT|nr:MAG: Cation efflux protein [Candidatus Uhrbacteria bacterium GW2011_GWA2_41_10]KKR87130.1 MAG: Cation efflux protein [Candidatus Uhrbacteria bacterium GW2011_GWC2_41_11]KKR97878.1 MAG: Cation efflux protein [Candidatus Uhrbacteria bacterium GW2011_GWF2_41_16]